MMLRIGSWCIARPKWLIGGMLLVSLLAASGAYRLTLHTDYRYFFDVDDPGMLALAELEAEFGSTDDFIVGIVPAEGDALSPDSILQLAELHDALLDTPYVHSVVSVAGMTVAVPFVSNAAGANFTSLRQLAEAGQGDTAQWQQAAAEVRRLSAGILLAEDSSIAAAHMRIALPKSSDFWDSGAVYRYSLAVKESMQAAHPGLNVVLAGVLPYYHLAVELAIRDIYSLFPLCLAIAVLMMLLLLGSVQAAAVSATPVLCAVVTSVGLAGWLGLQVTSVTMGVPILVMVIALAYAVHVTDTHLQLRAACSSAADAALLAQKENMKPVLLTAGTTILGFLAMNASISPPYRQMGNLSALGVLVAVIYVLLVLPALLAIVDPPHQAEHAPLRRGLDYLARRYSKPIQAPGVVALVAIGIIGLLACVPLNKVDDDMSTWLSDDIPLRQDHVVLAERLTGMMRLYYKLPTASDAAVHDPAYLQTAEAFAAWAMQQELVVAVHMLPPLVRGLNQSLADGRFELPQDAKLTEQLLWAYELSAPPNERFGGLVNLDRSASVVLLMLQDLSGQELQAFDRLAKAWLNANAPELQAPGGLGGLAMFSSMVSRNVPPMIFSTVGVLLLAAMLIGLVFRSLRLALISVVPNLLPLGLAFGSWGLLSGNLGIGLSVVCTAAVGIFVDDSIHLMARYRDGRDAAGGDPAAGCGHAIRRVGGAITITTVVLCLGIGMMGFSELQPTSHLGIWLAIAIAYAWFCDLFLLPQLLLRLDR